ncbi:MAG: TetR/AcrR family transcriptional regulator [Pseudomonadota bacterium]
MSVPTIDNAPPKKRKTQERTEETKRKLLEAATREFANRGFDAVTARDIEAKADVQRGLLGYHFGSKQDIWYAVLDGIIDEYYAYRGARLEVVKDLSVHERLSFRIRAFVRFSATRPELHQLMMQEGKRDSWRLRYLIENFLVDSSPDLREMAQSDLALSDEEYVHWYYMYLGAGALVFSLTSEAESLFGVDVNDEEFITRHANLVADFLTGSFSRRLQ